MKANKLFIILAILFVYMYVVSARSVAPSFELLQTNLQHFESSMLREKLPVIFEDKIVDIQDVVSNMFKFLYISRYDDTSLSFPFQIVICKSRFTLIHNTNVSTPFHICIYHPKYITTSINDPIVSNRHFTVIHKHNAESQIIRLHPNKMVVIPYKWAYSIHDDVAKVNPEDLKRIHLHDFIS